MSGETRASEGEGVRLSSDGRATPAHHADDRRLRASEARYQALVAATAQIVWTTPADGVVDDMPAWRAYTGQSVEEVRGRGWLDALHPEDRARAARLWDEAVATRRVCEAECRVRRHDGAYRSFLVRGVPVLDDDGGIREWVGICTDVTARKQAEAALRASEELRRTVVANAPLVLFAVDRDGIFTLSEGRGLAALGIQPDEHVGQSYFALYGHLQDSAAALKRTLAGEASTTVERYKGLVFETQWMPTRDAEGTVTGAIGVSSDITERARADEERQRLERRTRAALEALLAMAQALVQAPDDTAGDAPVENVARQLGALMRDVLGCRSVSMIGLTPPDHLRPLVCVGLSPEQEEAWRGRITHWPRDTDLFRVLATRLRAGETVLIDTTQPEYQAMANPFAIERYLLAPMYVGAALVGVLAIDDGPAVPDADHIALVEAVTQLAGLVLERERLQREREEARSSALALHEANRRMDEFLGIAGHEMRTPLTASIGNIQLVQRRLGRLRARDDLLPAVVRELDEAHHLLNRGNASLGRLSILVSDLLDVSCIQAGRLQVWPQPCDLAEVVRVVIDEQRELAATRTIRLDLPDAAVPVQADAARIGQVVTNYLSNALKYSAEDQPVSVGLEVVGSLARVWVRDEGPGVAPEERARIWERFYRAARVEHRYGSSVGLGLGLHISRTIIVQHGGEVGVESGSGVGATFWFTLPLDERAAPDVAPEGRRG